MLRSTAPLLLTALLLPSAVARADAAAAAAGAADERATDERAVRETLTRSAEAWNRGDLDGFLDSYEHGAGTTFVTAHEVLHGFDAVRAMYRRHHPAHDPKQMGALTFRDLEVKPLGAEWAVAVGRWNLAREAKQGGDASGWFTLTLHKSAAGWRIVVDHTP